MEGNKDFLAALFKPPAVEWKGVDYRQAAQLPFPAFIAGRVRLFSQTVPGVPRAATVPRLWCGYWFAMLRVPFDTFPLFQGGRLRFAPSWQNDAAIYCKGETMLSNFAPVYRATRIERVAVEKLAAWFPCETVWDMYGLDNITPAMLLLVRAILAAQHDDTNTALEHLAVLGVPSTKKRLPFPQIPDPEWARVPMPPNVALPFVRFVRRMLGRFRLSAPGGEMRGYALNIEANVKHVAAALGVSRPTLYAWAARAKPAAGRRVGGKGKGLICRGCGEPDTGADTCPHCDFNLAMADRFRKD